MKATELLGKLGVVGILLAVVLPSPLPAPLTGYLKIPDIPGESKATEHENEIDITDISWELARPSSTGTSREYGAADFKEFKAVKYLDKSSPYLALACAQGKILPELVLTLRKDSGDAHLDYLTITLTNVRVTSYSVGGSGDTDDRPTEEVAFYYNKIAFSYTLFDETGRPAETTEMRWDLETNTEG